VSDANDRGLTSGLGGRRQMVGVRIGMAELPRWVRSWGKPSELPQVVWTLHHCGLISQWIPGVRPSCLRISGLWTAASRTAGLWLSRLQIPSLLVAQRLTADRSASRPARQRGSTQPNPCRFRPIASLPDNGDHLLAVVLRPGSESTSLWTIGVAISVEVARWTKILGSHLVPAG
jgi:hypothetical protein